MSGSAYPRLRRRSRDFLPGAHGCGDEANRGAKADGVTLERGAAAAGNRQRPRAQQDGGGDGGWVCPVHPASAQGGDPRGEEDAAGVGSGRSDRGGGSKLSRPRSRGGQYGAQLQGDALRQHVPHRTPLHQRGSGRPPRDVHHLRRARAGLLRSPGGRHALRRRRRARGARRGRRSRRSRRSRRPGLLAPAPRPAWHRDGAPRASRRAGSRNPGLRPGEEEAPRIGRQRHPYLRPRRGRVRSFVGSGCDGGGGGGCGGGCGSGLDRAVRGPGGLPRGAELRDDGGLDALDDAADRRTAAATAAASGGTARRWGGGSAAAAVFG
ncbi:unnamed protein product [Ectocarpus sp. 4 AP-2014]